MTEPLMSYEDLRQAVLLMWALLVITGALAWDWGPKGSAPINRKGRGAAAVCKQHGRPSHECRDEHRP